MEQCWLCTKAFSGKTELNAHLAPKEHRRQTVICPWCPDEKTFTRVTDLNAHCQNRHFIESHLMPKSFLGLNNCFYFALYPQDYAKMHKPEGWTSPHAIEARRLIISMVEGRDDAATKRENWRMGWREGLKVRTEGVDGKENQKKAKRVRVENEYKPDDLKKVTHDYKVYKAAHEKTNANKRKATNETKEDDKKRSIEKRALKQVSFNDTKTDEKKIEKKIETASKTINIEEKPPRQSQETERENRLVIDMEQGVGETGCESENVMADVQTEQTQNTNKEFIATKVTDSQTKDNIQQPKETKLIKTESGVWRRVKDGEEKNVERMMKYYDCQVITVKDTSEDNVEKVAKIKENSNESSEKKECNSEISVKESVESEGEETETEDENPMDINVMNGQTNDTRVANERVIPNLGFTQRATAILNTGAMPLCPPARRDWTAEDLVNFVVVGHVFAWPPQDWVTMSSDRRLLAWEHTALQLEFLTSGGLSPNLSRGYLLEKYNFLTLPGTAKYRKEMNERAASKARHYTYQMLREIAMGRSSSDAEKFQIVALEKIVQQGPLEQQLRILNVPMRLAEANQCVAQSVK